MRIEAGGHVTSRLPFGSTYKAGFSHQRIGDVQSPIIQQLAFLDACVIAEQPHGGAWRRRQVFEDDSGQTWRAIALLCWREVRLEVLYRACAAAGDASSTALRVQLRRSACACC